MKHARLFDTHVVVDWSARSKPSPVRPTKDAIFWCTVRDGEALPVDYARTRAATRTRLTSLIRKERDAGRRVLLGFDFPFSDFQNAQANIVWVKVCRSRTRACRRRNMF